MGSVATLGAAGLPAGPATAGLVMFPPDELNNNYILVRFSLRNTEWLLVCQTARSSCMQSVTRGTVAPHRCKGIRIGAVAPPPCLKAC